MPLRASGASFDEIHVRFRASALIAGAKGPLDHLPAGENVFGHMRAPSHWHCASEHRISPPRRGDRLGRSTTGPGL